MYLHSTLCNNQIIKLTCCIYSQLKTYGRVPVIIKQQKSFTFLSDIIYTTNEHSGKMDNKSINNLQSPKTLFHVNIYYYMAVHFSIMSGSHQCFWQSVCIFLRQEFPYMPPL